MLQLTQAWMYNAYDKRKGWRLHDIFETGWYFFKRIKPWFYHADNW